MGDIKRIKAYQDKFDIKKAAQCFQIKLGHSYPLDAAEDYIVALLSGKMPEENVLPSENLIGAYQAALSSLLCDVISMKSPFKKDLALDGLVNALADVFMHDLVRVQSLTESALGMNDSGRDAIAMQVMDNAVDSSMAINNLFIECLRAEDIAMDVDHRVNSISAAIEEMTVTVATISQNSAEALDFSSQARENAQAGRRASDQALEMMGVMKQAVGNTTIKTGELSNSSKQIEGIISKIQKIAEQTNLLALNATIEAARAGEAGKGFAVVANEVKTLANETSAATTEIADIIGSLVVAIEEIVGAMDQVSLSVDTSNENALDIQQRMGTIEDQSARVSQRMDDISHALKEQGQASSEIAQASVKILENSAVNKDISVSNAGYSRKASEKNEELMANMAEMTKGQRASIIKLAKSDHVVWKRKLADMLAGKAALDDAALKDHTQCRLGQWYYALDDDEMCGLKAFRALEEPHEKVHKCGIEAFSLYKSGQHDAAFAKMAELEAASMDVIAILNEIDAWLAAA